MICKQFLLIVSVYLITAIRSQYITPRSVIRLLRPRGFQLSIALESGGDVSGELRFRMIGRDADRQTGWFCYGGHWSSGRLTFRIEEASLQPGDVIIYATYIKQSMGDYYSEMRAFEVDADRNGVLTSRLLPSDYEPSQTTAVPVVTTQQPPPDNCTRSLTLVRDPTDRFPCVNELIFEDQFTTTLDRRMWRVEQRFSTQPDFEFNMYMDRSETVAIRDRHLALGVHRLGNEFDVSALKFGANCTGLRTSRDECLVPPNLNFLFSPPIAAGQLSTAGIFGFRYGRVEVRAQLPAANWIFPQVQLLPVDLGNGSADTASGLMRLAWAAPGQDPYAGVLLRRGLEFRDSGVCRSQGAERQWINDHHVFTMVWRPDGISFEMDGIESCRINATGLQEMVKTFSNLNSMGTTAMAPFDRMFYLQLGVGVAGLNDFREAVGKPWRNDDPQQKDSFWREMRNLTDAEWPGSRAQLLVDYVKVYALD